MLFMKSFRLLIIKMVMSAAWISLVVFTEIGYGQDPGQTFQKFVVRPDLNPIFSLHDLPTSDKFSIEYSNGFWGDIENGQLQPENSEYRKSRSRINIRFSSVAAADMGDPRPWDLKIDKLTLLKSLPNAPTYQEGVEAVGKIFEPKLNLSIEF